MDLKISGELFSTKTDAIARLQQILHKYDLGQPIAEKKDQEFLEAVLARHADAPSKLNGREISHFTVNNRDYGTRCFYVHFTNGEFDHFSFKKCL